MNVNRIRIVSCLTAGLAAIACALPLRGEPLTIEARIVPLNPNDETMEHVGLLKYRGGMELRSPDPRFGGLSGLLVNADGTRLYAVSDKGYWVEARLRYDRGGRLTGVARASIGPLAAPGGENVIGSSWADAESMAWLEHGVAVAFEVEHRIWIYPRVTNPLAVRPRSLRAPEGIWRAAGHGGIEAMTGLRNGRLLAISEQLLPDKQTFLAWLTKGRVWEPLSYGRNGQYLPTGAAALPDGDVLVLEHRSSWTGGVASRIARVSLKAVRPGAVLNGNVLAVLEPPLVSAKFEGIAARRAADGTTLIYIVSDDNYNSPQGTILLMFALGR